MLKLISYTEVVGSCLSGQLVFNFLRFPLRQPVIPLMLVGRLVITQSLHAALQNLLIILMSKDFVGSHTCQE